MLSLQLRRRRIHLLRIERELRLLPQALTAGRAARYWRFSARSLKKGRDLSLALTALRQWGDEYLTEKPARVLRRKSDKKPVIAALVPKGSDAIVSRRDVEFVRAPGSTR